ncbi:hypothetical protein GGR52DRAFT_573572 [Hypoxylon sp. FL1284]|nr:hypothetical protein GGR52DRAFT_573572 [Hypoxylon sp. FL1284]
MCKQYVYTVMCPSPACGSRLGTRKRKRPCAAALRARRLGRCAAGVQTAGRVQLIGHASRCRRCRERAAAVAGGRGRRLRARIGKQRIPVIRFTSYFSAADNRVRATREQQPVAEEDVAEEDVTEEDATEEDATEELDAEEPGVAQGGSKRQISLLESFEADLAALEAEFDQRATLENKPARLVKIKYEEEEEKFQERAVFAGINSCQNCPDCQSRASRYGLPPCRQGLRADQADTNPYGFKSSATAQQQQQTCSCPLRNPKLADYWP